MRHTVSCNTGHKRTSGSDQTGWQKTGRPNFDTTARRQTFDLGRHRGEHTGSFIFVVFCSVCRRRSRPRGSPTRIFFNQSQCQCPLLSRHFGRTLDWYLRRLARDVISIPKTRGHYAAFQFGLNTRELCFCRWRTGPLAIPTCDFSFMF